MANRIATACREKDRKKRVDVDVKANSALVEEFAGTNIVIFVMTTSPKWRPGRKKVRGCVLPSVPTRNFRGS